MKDEKVLDLPFDTAVKLSRPSCAGKVLPCRAEEAKMRGLLLSWPELRVMPSVHGTGKTDGILRTYLMKQAVMLLNNVPDL